MSIMCEFMITEKINFREGIVQQLEIMLNS